MPDYVIRAEIAPRFPFGLPDGRHKLRPSDTDLCRLSEELAAEVSFPRPDSHAIRFDALVGGYTASLVDNVLSLHITAEDQSQATERADESVAKYVRGLMLERGYEFQGTLTHITDETGEERSLQVGLGSPSSTYSLRKMRRAMNAAAAMSSNDDAVLQKALIYMEHAQVLMHASHFHPHLESRAFLIAPAFLSVWKALTVILGDPSTDRDYQSRVRRFGFPRGFWTDRVKPIKDVRDSMDVAHYSLELDVENGIRTAYWDAERLCREVLLKYFRWLEQSAR